MNASPEFSQNVAHLAGFAITTVRDIPSNSSGHWYLGEGGSVVAESGLAGLRVAEVPEHGCEKVRVVEDDGK